jgi:hypothetical protein
MESGDKLYKLISITGGNGTIAPTLMKPFKLHNATYFAGDGPYSLQSSVYLYAGKDDLTGLSLSGSVGLVESEPGL